MLRPLLLSAVAVAIATAFAPLPSPLRASPRTLAATATGSEHLLGHGDPSHVPSKLQAITAEVAGAIPAAKAVRSEGDLEAAVAAFDAELGAPVDLFARLRRESAGTARRVALAAEFKRASPSKGPIALDLDAAEQVRAATTTPTLLLRCSYAAATAATAPPATGNYSRHATYYTF